MIIVRSPKQMYEIVKNNKLKGKTIGFVPTMGALHRGHLSLIRKARQENNIAVVSIFVNPLQFSPKEDLKRYPRPLKNDISFCQDEGVDLIFYPKVNQMYPDDLKAYVTVNGLSDCLCGKLRPGHFKGVATVVTKLFNIVCPDVAYFGQKDFQQAVIIKKMVYDLNLPVKIKVMPTVREKDGLALSSRNIYLSGQDRSDALVLFASLNLAKNLIDNGVRNTGKIINSMKKLILKKNKTKIDYISIVDVNTLEPVKKIRSGSLIALAVRVGKTRLIDNIIINPTEIKK